MAIRAVRPLATNDVEGDTRPMTARWIVGVDGSEAAVDALRWAVGHGADRGAEITAIAAFHVPAIMAIFTAKRGFGVDELGLAATAGHDVDTAIEAAGSDGGAVVVHPSVVEGQAQHVLVDASVDADLVVIGRTGSGELRHHLLGSVSQYCVTHSHAPVALVPSGATRTTSSIVVGFDGSEHAAEALRWALDFAGTTARVRVVAAIEVAPWVDEDLSRDRFGDEIEREQQRLTGALEVIDPAGRAERSIVLQGPRQALAEAQQDADLVVVGTRGRGVIAAGLLGSVSAWLVHDAVRPVVVVPSR
jgi:nucleotide-binding universal stress UspA family protein